MNQLDTILTEIRESRKELREEISTNREEISKLKTELTTTKIKYGSTNLFFSAIFGSIFGVIATYVKNKFFN